MSKKIRTKKNNSHERAYRMSKAYVDGYAVVRFNTNPCVLFDMARDTLVLRPSENLSRHFVNVQYKWTVMLVVGCRERNGKFKLVTDQISFRDRRTQAQLAEYLGEEHIKMVDECREVMTIEYIGWIGSVLEDTDFVPEHVEKVFSMLDKIYGEDGDED